jgi:hypothetical protein
MMTYIIVVRDIVNHVVVPQNAKLCTSASNDYDYNIIIVTIIVTVTKIYSV